MRFARPSLLLTIALAWIVLASGSLATIAQPVSGTPLTVKVRETIKIKLKNANGCKFTFMAGAAPGGIVLVGPDSGSDLTSETVEVTGLAVGVATLTIMSAGGCPMATHTYPVTVIPNTEAIPKQFDVAVKSSLKLFKTDVSASYKNYDSFLKTIRQDFDAGTLNEDTLQDQFHSGSVQLRRDVYGAGYSAYWGVIGAGTNELVGNDVALGDGPSGLFAGGCGTYDGFQDSICGEFSKFHSNFRGRSKKAIANFEKLGAPQYGQWNVMLPIFGAGPLYKTQLGTPAPPMLFAVTTITSKPATNMSFDNGRILFSGTADGVKAASVDCTLTKTVMGSPDLVTTKSVSIDANEWTSTFDLLTPGTYSFLAKIPGDSAGVGFTIPILKQPLF